MENIDRIVEVMEALTKIALFIISLIGGYAATKLPPKWQNEAKEAVLAAEEKMRNALHSAARSGIEAGQIAGLKGNDLLQFALLHMIKSVPDAIVGLIPGARDIINSGPAEEVLRRIPGPIRRVLENIIVSKVDPTLDDLRSGGWTAPVIPSTSDLQSRP